MSDRDSGEDEDSFPSGKDCAHWCADTDWDMYSRSHISPVEREIFRESTKRPQVLVGLRINVEKKGAGEVQGLKRSIGRPTKFKILFDNGSIEFLPLKRGPKKGSIYFSFVRKALI